MINPLNESLLSGIENELKVPSKDPTPRRTPASYAPPVDVSSNGLNPISLKFAKFDKFLEADKA